MKFFTDSGYILLRESRDSRPVSRLGLRLNAAAIIIALLWVIGMIVIMEILGSEPTQGGPFMPGGW